MVSNWFSVIKPRRCGNSSVSNTVLREEGSQAGDEVVETGRVRKDVVGDEQVGSSVLLDEHARNASSPKNSTTVGMPFATATSATFAAGSIPSARIPAATTCWSR